jgi:hypothetical protein
VPPIRRQEQPAFSTLGEFPLDRPNSSKSFPAFDRLQTGVRVKDFAAISIADIVAMPVSI